MRSLATLSNIRGTLRRPGGIPGGRDGQMLLDLSGYSVCVLRVCVEVVAERGSEQAQKVRCAGRRPLCLAHREFHRRIYTG